MAQNQPVFNIAQEDIVENFHNTQEVLQGIHNHMCSQLTHQ